MTRSAVGQLDAFLGEKLRNMRIAIGIINKVIFCFRSMTTQTETHVKHLRILGNFHLAQIAVTILAVQASRHMRTMGEMHKVRHLHNGNPFKSGCWLICGGIDQSAHGRKPFACVGNIKLLMATPAFRYGW